jgi:hypothetical protein
MHGHLQVPRSKANPRHDAPRNHAPAPLHQLPGEAIPATVRRCAAWPAMTPWHCAIHSHIADVPHPRKGTAEPSKERWTTTPRPRKDNAVRSGQRDRSPPSPSVLCDRPHRPQHHPGHCIAISCTVGGWGDKTLPHRLLCALQPPISRTLEPMYRRRPHGRPLHRHPRSHSWADIGHTMTPRQVLDSSGRSSTSWLL